MLPRSWLPFLQIKRVQPAQAEAPTQLVLSQASEGLGCNQSWRGSPHGACCSEKRTLSSLKQKDGARGAAGSWGSGYSNLRWRKNRDVKQSMQLEMSSTGPSEGAVDGQEPGHPSPHGFLLCVLMWPKDRTRITTSVRISDKSQLLKKRICICSRLQTVKVSFSKCLNVW